MFSHNVLKEKALYVYNATTLTVGHIPRIPSRTLPTTSQQAKYQKPKVSQYSRNIIRLHLRNKSAQWNTQLICSFPLSLQKHASIPFKIYFCLYQLLHQLFLQFSVMTVDEQIKAVDPHDTPFRIYVGLNFQHYIASYLFYQTPPPYMYLAASRRTLYFWCPPKMELQIKTESGLCAPEPACD